MILEVKNEDEMKALGVKIGALLNGGEIIELIGDVGSGKTTLTKGVAVGLDITDNVQSPSFTISRVYQGRDNILLAHYDFYRLNNAGIMANEVQEAISDSKSVIIIEWGGVINNILPVEKLSIQITTVTDTSRHLDIKFNGDKYASLVGKL